MVQEVTELIFEPERQFDFKMNGYIFRESKQTTDDSCELTGVEISFILFNEL